MKKTTSKLLLFGILAAAVIAFFVFDLGQFATLDNLKQHRQAFAQYYDQHTSKALLIYFLLYVAMAALSLPGAAVMTLAGGALFGLGTGLFMVSFASSVGATLAFLVSRFLLRDSVEKRFGDKLAAINEGVRNDGSFYLFSLRLVPVFPFFAINLAMGLTPIRTANFYIVSQLGMLPGTFVYVNAGTQLAAIDSLAGILSPGLMVSFALLGVFPLLAKRILAFIQNRRAFGRWPRPKKYDYNMVVIGGGSAGLVASYIAAAVKARVALVEKNKLGGDCLNTGCVPSKALIRSAKMLAHARRADEYGFRSGKIDVDFVKMMERVQQIIRKVEPHDSIERYTGLGVDVLKGDARIQSPFEVEVDDRVLTTRSIIVATGARPFVPPIPGLDQVAYLTSDNIWSLRTLPKRLVVLGGGPIGSELTQTFARLGSQVTQVEMQPQIMGREDEDVAETVRKKFEKEGVRVLTGHKAQRVVVEGEHKTLICEGPDGEVDIDFDEILVAVGRTANASGFGLEELGVKLRPNGTIETNGLLQTNFPNIYCTGDVAGPYQFTHTAAHQSWYAAVNALFGTFKRFSVDYSVIPWATYTDPEVARVGLNIREAEEKGLPYEVTNYGMDDLDRAIADGEAHGFVRILTKPGTDKILGVTIVGAHAGDLIAEYVLAMKHKLGLNKILGTIHIYPTLAEANKYAAGAWKRAHAPQNLLNWFGRYHAWMRG
jgi:dihydrolipoamide dehydrogenase